MEILALKLQYRIPTVVFPFNCNYARQVNAGKNKFIQ